MNNIIINSKSNEKVVAEKRAIRLKKAMLSSILSFGIIFGSMDSGICTQKETTNSLADLRPSKFRKVNKADLDRQTLILFKEYVNEYIKENQR